MSKHLNSKGYWLRVFLGCVVAFVGFIGAVVGIIGILDPVGSKMADDNDPLGTPRPLPEALAITLFFFLLLALGILLTLKRSKTPPA